MERTTNKISKEQIEDLRLAASKMTGAKRRSFQAEMSIKYCEGKARKTEEIFKWGRANVKLGIEERRTGITCIGSQSMTGGAKLWEEKYPEIANILWELAERHSQQDPTFESIIAYTRLTCSRSNKTTERGGFCRR